MNSARKRNHRGWMRLLLRARHWIFSYHLVALPRLCRSCQTSPKLSWPDVPPPSAGPCRFPDRTWLGGTSAASASHCGDLTQTTVPVVDEKPSSAIHHVDLLESGYSPLNSDPRYCPWVLHLRFTYHHHGVRPSKPPEPPCYDNRLFTPCDPKPDQVGFDPSRPPPCLIQELDLLSPDSPPF